MIMKPGLLLLFVSLMPTPVNTLDCSQVLKGYSDRPKEAMLQDSVRVQIRLLSRLQAYSRNSTYILQGMSSDRIKLIDSLVQFILLQRDMERGHFYDNSQFHSVVGFTSRLIEESACDYLQESLSSLYYNFNCSTHQLQDISQQLKLYMATDSVNDVTWSLARLARHTIKECYECALWSTKIATGQAGRQMRGVNLTMLNNAMRIEYNNSCHGIFEPI